MAEAKVENAEGEKKKSKLPIIIVAVVLVLALAAGAAFFLLGGKKKSKHGEGEDEHKEEAHKSVSVPFEEKFTVNLHSDDGTSHFMQVPKMELEVTDAVVAKEIEEKKNKISDRISSALRGKTMSELLEQGADVKLKEDLKLTVNKVLEKGKGVEEVILPQSFIVQ